MKRLAILAVLLLTGCLAEPPAEPEPIDYAELAQTALAGQAGVVEVALTQDPDESVTLGVTMADTATVEQVEQIAEAVQAFCTEYAVPGQWTAGVGFELIDQEPDDDLPAQDHSGFPVYPEAVDAADFMAVKGAPGVRSALFGSGFPFVTVASASDLLPTHELLNGMPLWQQGGTLWAENGRVRLTELPDSLTPAGYDLIIAASVAYPAAQFWLEAPTTGHGWPQLFVDQVSVDEAPAVATALGTPTNAAAFDVNFFIRAIGPDGPVDSGGVLGKS